MSATIHHLNPAAVDPRKDPWHAVLGHPLHRETFPFWERQPADIQAWLKASQEEFPVFGFCQATQGIPIGKLIESLREEEEASRELLTAYIGLHRHTR